MNSKPLKRDLEYFTWSLVSVTSFNLRMRLSLGLRLIIVLPVYCIITSYKTLIYERKPNKTDYNATHLIVSNTIKKIVWWFRKSFSKPITNGDVSASSIAPNFSFEHPLSGNRRNVFSAYDCLSNSVLSLIEAIGSCAISRNFKENCWQRGKHTNSACV